MGNILTVISSKKIKTKAGLRYLSICKYKFEDRNFNLFDPSEQADSKGVQFWNDFWRLWNSDTDFKKILKKFGFQPTKRRVMNVMTGESSNIWNLQMNHWLEIKEKDMREMPKKTPSGRTILYSDLLRAKSFSKCYEEIMPILTKEAPEYLTK